MLSILIGGGILLFYAGIQLQKRCSRAQEKQRSLFGPWPIAKTSITNLDPHFQTTELGPKRENEIIFLPNIRVKGGISDLETWVLCTLAKKATRIFEFGTCTGKTTYLLAKNSPKKAQIVTITLSPSEHTTYQEKKGDSDTAYEEAIAESCFQTFYYSNTVEEKKITQLYGDSKKLDEGPYEASFDLIFIDGSHAYSYILSDTKKALKMLKKGGWLLWHDYRGPKRNRDVFRALNSLNKNYPLHHIEKTSLVAFKK